MTAREELPTHPVLHDLAAAVRERGAHLAAMRAAESRLAEHLAHAVAAGLDPQEIVAALDGIEPAAPRQRWTARPLRLRLPSPAGDTDTTGPPCEQGRPSPWFKDEWARR
ncbi:hypothetical protein ACFVUN_35845 [Kitasatospora griseola]|uniref:hypothetical protein n=1 Tax=Kitasatospora griseola TaxID=2064 RepID=UPI0036D7D16B